MVGTLWNSIGIGMSLFAVCQIEAFGVQDINLQENLLFASIISAVDPVAVLSVFEDVSVNEALYIVVFGECLFNDAVTVVSVLLCFVPFRKMSRDLLRRAGSFSGPHSCCENTLCCCYRLFVFNIRIQQEVRK